MSIQCPVCLSENNENAITCGVCGAALQANNSSPSYHLPNNSILQQGKGRSVVLERNRTVRQIPLCNNRSLPLLISRACKQKFMSYEIYLKNLSSKIQS